LIIPVAKMVQLAYNDTRSGWTDQMITYYEKLALDYAISLRSLFGGISQYMQELVSDLH
jgi:hypothetical protein